MESILKILKGVHPGRFIDRELKKQNSNQRQLALAVNEHPQTINAIINAKRSINTKLALKIEEKLGLEEGFLMTLQVYYDIKQAKFDKNYKPDLSKLRKGTFWDTTFDRIDWKLMKRAVITRVFAYGDDEEQQEIIRFYGKEEVERINKLYPPKLTR
jgi:addiction module HigA family antidote